jgi:hypothetical protein
MSNIQIGGLPAASSVASGDLIPVSQTGVTRSATVTQVAGAIAGSFVVNPMTAVNDTIVGGASGAPIRFAAPTTAGSVFAFLGGALTWASGVFTNVINSFSKIAYASMTVVSSATGTYTPDCTAISNSLMLTITGNLTLANPTTPIAGMVLNIFLYENATGSHTITLGSAYKFAAGTAPTWVTTASARNLLSCAYDGTNWICGSVTGAA